MTIIMENKESNYTKLELEALKRKERLKALKRKANPDSEPAPEDETSTAEENVEENK